MTHATNSQNIARVHLSDEDKLFSRVRCLNTGLEMDQRNQSCPTSRPPALLPNSRRVGLRVGKACDRCRLKKGKCDGSRPCQKCKEANTVCIYSQRMKLHARNHPKGYVEILERQQDQLVAALRQSYRLLKEANAWSGPPLAETDGHPLTHDLLAALHVLEPDYEITKANTIFEEDYDKIRSSLIDQRRNSSQSYGSPEADSVNGPLTPFAVESAQPTSILQQYKGCEEVSSSQVQGTESPRHLSSPSSLASFDFGELPSPSQEFPRSWEEMTRASLPTSLPMLTLATDTPMRQTDLSTPDRDKGSISSLNFDFNRLDQPSKPQPDLGLEARRLSIRLSDGPIRLASDEEPYDFFDGMMELCLGWAM